MNLPKILKTLIFITTFMDPLPPLVTLDNDTVGC